MSLANRARAAAALEWIRAQGRPVTAEEVAAAIGIARGPEVSAVMHILHNEGMIRKAGRVVHGPRDSTVHTLWVAKRWARPSHRLRQVVFFQHPPNVSELSPECSSDTPMGTDSDTPMGTDSDTPMGTDSDIDRA